MLLCRAAPELKAITLEKLRLMPAPPIDGASSARVTFDMSNAGERSLTDCVAGLAAGGVASGSRQCAARRRGRSCAHPDEDRVIRWVLVEL
jgi:hypothetical protein